MNDELHSNDWIADVLLTVLAESREIPITGVAPVESAEPSDEPTEADRKQSNETIDEPTRREPPKKRVPVKQPARVPWTAVLIDAFCCIAIFCAVAWSLYALVRDFSPKPLTRSQSLTSASALENVVTQESALAENSAPNVLNAPTVSEEPPIEITTDAAPESDLAIDSNAVEETIANNENAAPESDLAIDSNAIAETIANNENAVKNVEPDETPIPDAAPLSENTFASTPAIKSKPNSENVKPKETSSATPQIYTKKICDVKIGERAVGTNPQGANPLESDDTIFERVKHYGYKLSYQKANGTYCHINLLRPEDWLEYAEIQLRGKNSGRVLEELDFQIAEFSPLNFFDYDDCVPEIWLELPEMGVVGWAKLEDVDKNVSVRPGPGNVVTGTFAHISDDVIDLLIEDQDKPIGCTSNHPFWSVDRQDFVDAGELQEGERVQLYNGETKRVVIKLPRPGPQNVYNLEIYSEHAYRVTLDGILVHNECAPYYLGKGRPYFRQSSKQDILSGLSQKQINKIISNVSAEEKQEVLSNGVLTKLPKGFVYGHIKGFEYWRLKRWAQGRLTREQWNDFYNHPAFYQVEDAITNAKHINEELSEYEDLTENIIKHLGGKELVKLFGKEETLQIFGEEKLKEILGQELFNKLFN